MEAAAGPGPEPAGHLVVTKPLPYTRRWLALLLPLHPPSLLGTDLNQGDAQIFSSGAPLRPRRAEGCPFPGLMSIQACANTLSHPSPVPHGMRPVPRVGEPSLAGTGRRLPASPISALSRGLSDPASERPAVGLPQPARDLPE